MLSHNSNLVVVSLYRHGKNGNCSIFGVRNQDETGVRHCQRAGNSSVQAFSTRGMFDEAEPRLSETEDLFSMALRTLRWTKCFKSSIDVDQ